MRQLVDLYRRAASYVDRILKISEPFTSIVGGPRRKRAVKRLAELGFSVELKPAAAVS
jgi:hypothetical protein